MKDYKTGLPQKSLTFGFQRLRNALQLKMKALLVLSSCCPFVLTVSQIAIKSILINYLTHKKKIQTFSCFWLSLWRVWLFLTTPETMRGHHTTAPHLLKSRYLTRLPSKKLRRPRKLPWPATFDVAITDRQLKIQVTTKCQLVILTGIVPFTILFLLWLVQTNTARLSWYSSTASRKWTHLQSISEMSTVVDGNKFCKKNKSFINPCVNNK